MEYGIGCHICCMHYSLTWAGCHVWWGTMQDVFICFLPSTGFAEITLHVRSGPLNVSQFLFVSVQVDSSPAAMKTATTGSSSATGESAGVSTRTEGKWPDLGFAASQTAVSPIGVSCQYTNRIRSWTLNVGREKTSAVDQPTSPPHAFCTRLPLC